MAETRADQIFGGDPALRAKQCWQYLGCGHSFFYGLVKSGKLPQGVLVGGCRVWRRSVLDRFLEDCGAKSVMQREPAQ